MASFRTSSQRSSIFSERDLRVLNGYKNASLIVVIGLARTGKSSLICSIPSEGRDSSQSYVAEAAGFGIAPKLIEGKQFVFLDMPGFNSTNTDGWNTFSSLMTNLSNVLQYVSLGGILYVDPMNVGTYTLAVRKNLTWLWRFCGKGSMPSITFVTTKWDILNSDGVQLKQSYIRGLCEQEPLRNFLDHGAKIYHHRYDGITSNSEDEAAQLANSARRMIWERYHEASFPKLLVQVEILMGCTIERTSAGRLLNPPNSQSSGNTRDSHPAPESDWDRAKRHVGFVWSGLEYLGRIAHGYMLSDRPRGSSPGPDDGHEFFEAETE